MSNTIDPCAVLCEDCANIAVDGFSHRLRGTQDHLDKLATVRALLPEHAYWGQAIPVEVESLNTCESCGSAALDRIVFIEQE